MNFFAKLSGFFSRLMYGRYGNDSLNQFLIVLWFAEAIVNIFLHSLILYLLGTVLCVIVIFRMFSKNIVKRRRENAAWYHFSQKMRSSYQLLKVRIRDRKIARFFKCPRCKAPIRMPRKIGKFNIRCTKCGHSFQKEFKR